MRWLAMLLAFLFVVVALPALFLVLFRPLDPPETGYLASGVTRDFDVGAGRAAVLQLEVAHDPRIFRDSHADFPATLMHAEVAALNDSPGRMELRILGADSARTVDGVQGDPGSASVAWSIACEALRSDDTDDAACRRTYYAVITAPESEDVVRARLTVGAELPFPLHVPTPFLVGIALDADEVRAVDGTPMRLHTAGAEAVIAVSADDPVAWQPIAISADELPTEIESGGRVAGARLLINLERRGDAVPTGFDAPPPVRLAIIDGRGALIADLGLRPARAEQLTVPMLRCRRQPCEEEEFSLVVHWRDRADQAYELAWSVEATAIGAADLGLTAEGGRIEWPAPLTTGEADGTATIDPDHGREFEFPLEIDQGIGAGDGHLAPIAGVLRLELDLPDPEGMRHVYLNSGGTGSGSGIPLALGPGDPQAAVLDAMEGCRGTCFDWRLVPAAAGAPDGVGVPVMFTFDWRASVTLWPLDPFGSPTPTVHER